MFGNWIFKQTKRYHFFRILTKKGKLTPFVQVRKRILYKNRVPTPQEEEYIKNDIYVLKEIVKLLSDVR